MAVPINPTEASDRWRFRIQHDCDNQTLRDASLAKLGELKRTALGGAKIDHALTSAGVDVVRIVWMSQTITLVVGFHPGYALVGVQLPRVLAMFRKSVEARVHEEIKQLVVSCGGSPPSISDVPISTG